MGVSLEVVRWLRSNGHDAVHLRDQSLNRLSDPEVFAKAVAEDRVLLTLSRRSVRSLPEGRSLTLRERERSERSGERSSPHPAEPIDGGLARGSSKRKRRVDRPALQVVDVIRDLG